RRSKSWAFRPRPCNANGSKQKPGSTRNSAGAKPMTPERYQQIDGLLEQALEVEPERREAFLDQACGDDEELRRKIAILLSSSRQAGGFLDKRALDVAAGEIAQEQIQSHGRSLVGHELG